MNEIVYNSTNMKNHISIFKSYIVIIGLIIFGCENQNKQKNQSLDKDTLVAENRELEGPKVKALQDLYYGVDARFESVKKQDVHNATTIYDFLNEGEKEQIEHIYSVDVIMVKDNQLSQIHAVGTSAKLTEEQKKILKSTDYFSHFTIRTEFNTKNKETGQLEDRFFGPHITVVPEKQATYVNGKDALLDYLMVNSFEHMNVIKGDNLGAIKLSFTITKDGSVTDVKHDAMTTGYPSIDKKLIELLKNIPGKWIPAETSNGEKIDQELVFTFGPRDGC